MFWALLLYSLLIVVVSSLVGYIIARIEPLWRFWTWLVGTLLVHGKAVLTVALVLAWLQWSERPAQVFQVIRSLVER